MNHQQIQGGHELEFVTKYWGWIASPVGLGFFVKAVLWAFKKYDERMEEKIAAAFVTASKSITEDLGHLKSQTKVLESQMTASQERVREMNASIETLTLHMAELPLAVVRALHGDK